MDIHLADGSAFEVFEHVEVKCPIIFTTAYDEYALRAFHVNSIAYLLKPINRNDLQNALDKLETLCGTAGGQTPPFDFMKVMHELKKEESYKTHFLVPAKGDKLIPISVNDILFSISVTELSRRLTGCRCIYLFAVVGRAGGTA